MADLMGGNGDGGYGSSFKVLLRQPHSLGAGVVVIALRGDIYAHIVQAMFIEKMARELVTGSGIVRAFVGMSVHHPPHPKGRSKGKAHQQKKCRYPKHRNKSRSSRTLITPETLLLP